jgi:uncharacterized protein Yka (UPF0111/DUF47 family)
MGTIIVTVSNLLVECLQSSRDHDDFVAYYKKIKDYEHEADVVQNKIFDELNTTFITPFDREDINHLSATVDDIIDLMNGCAKRIMLYNPKNLPGSAIELAKLMQTCAGYIAQAIDELDSFKKRPAKIKEYCALIDDVEKKADDVYETFLIALFENEKDPIEIIKLRDILHELERATDVAKMVGKIIKTVIIKYS